MKLKWPTIKKILQIVVTIITTIIGTNVVSACVG